jgi:hypothetical protein
MAIAEWKNERRPELEIFAEKAGWPKRVYNLSDRITPLVGENPKRGASRERFDIYYGGVTVLEYICRASELRPDLHRPSQKKNPAGTLMEDISWDEGMGFIKVEP